MFHCLFCSKTVQLATELHNHLRLHKHEAVPKRLFLFLKSTQISNISLELIHLW